MSTRSGEFVTLRDLRKEVGNDAARLFYVMRSNDQHLDFDLELATARSNDNPVYYIQYAHARVASVMRQMQERGMAHDTAQGLASLARLSEPQEVQLIKRVSAFPEVVRQCAVQRAPHTLVHYLRDLANDFHTNYSAHQFIVEQAGLRDARLPSRWRRKPSSATASHCWACPRPTRCSPPWPNPRRAITNPSTAGAAASRMGGVMYGFAAGLAIAGIVYIKGPPSRCAGCQNRQGGEKALRGNEPPDAEAGDSSAEDPAKSYDFYDMLPKFEVVVPEKDKDVRPDTRSVPETRRGTYVLQAGSYKNFADADRVRAKLALQGIESKVQKVSVDSDTWHRIRIGPISKLDELNRLRQILRKADVDVLVIRVGD